MKTLESNHTIAALIAHVVSECEPVDREARFDEMLNECYSFKSIGGPFAYMQPSTVLAECDPTAYRCGVNDWADGEEWTEVEGETYADEDIEAARTGFIDGLNDELSDLEKERDELEDQEADERDYDELTTVCGKIDALEKFISECESYSF